MGVYIPGMEMPTECYVCPFFIDRNRDIISALKAAPTIIPAEGGDT